MKKKSKIIVIAAVFAVLFSACKTLNTNLTISQKAIPAEYNQQRKDTSNVASINWRQYFSDSVLLQLIDTAINNNIDLQIALQRVEVFQAQNRFAKGELLPKVNLTATGGVTKFGLYTMDGAGNIATEITPGQTVPIHLPDIYLGAQASWEIDIWGKLRNQKNAAKANFLAGIEGKNFVLSNIIADVATAYYELIALDNELDIINQTILKQEEALTVIKLKKDAGRANELAVQQFSAQLLHTQSLAKETEQLTIETENKINFLLGRFPQKISRVKQSLYADMPETINSGIPSQLLINRPDIRKAAFELQAAKFDLKAAKAAFFPNLNIMAGFGYQAFNPEFLFTTPASIAYNAIGGLIAPIINMNAIKNKFRQAKSAQLIAMYQYQNSILNGYTEVVNQLSNIKNLQEISTYKKQESEVLLQAVETSKELYTSAKANYLEVLLAQQNALMANIDLINALKRQRIGLVNIYRCLGGGWQ